MAKKHQATVENTNHVCSPSSERRKPSRGAHDPTPTMKITAAHAATAAATPYDHTTRCGCGGRSRAGTDQDVGKVEARDAGEKHHAEISAELSPTACAL